MYRYTHIALGIDLSAGISQHYKMLLLTSLKIRVDNIVVASIQWENPHQTLSLLGCEMNDDTWPRHISSTVHFK